MTRRKANTASSNTVANTIVVDTANVVANTEVANMETVAASANTDAPETVTVSAANTADTQTPEVVEETVEPEEFVKFEKGRNINIVTKSHERYKGEVVKSSKEKFTLRLNDASEHTFGYDDLK